MQVFGWHYTVEAIAEPQGLTWDEVYNMPTIEALNAMSYLKGKAKYIEEIKRL